MKTNSFDIRIRAEGSPFWLSCYCRLATRKECYEYVADLLERDEEVAEWRIMDDDRPPTHRWSAAAKRVLPIAASMVENVAANEDVEVEEDVPY